MQLVIVGNRALLWWEKKLHIVPLKAKLNRFRDRDAINFHFFQYITLKKQQ